MLIRPRKETIYRGSVQFLVKLVALSQKKLF